MPKKRPELMHIGNSLAQGVRSLTVKGEFGKLAVGAQLAKLQGWDFETQDHPKPVLLDVEKEIRGLSVGKAIAYRKTAEGLVKRVNANLKFWKQRLLHEGKAAHAPFDNLGMGAAVIEDLYQTGAHWRSQLEYYDRTGYALTVDSLLDGSGLGDAFRVWQAILRVKSSE